MAIPPAEEGSVPVPEVPASLKQLSGDIDSSCHFLASTGESSLAVTALQATKDIFELALNNESRSHPFLHPFLLSILEPPSVSLRSRTKKSKKAKSPSPALPDAATILPYTPLTELTTDGLDAEQVWAQLELRAESMVKAIKEVGPGEPMDPDQMDEDVGDEDDSEEDDDDSGEEMTEEEWDKMLLDQGIDQEFDSDEEDDSEGGSDDEDEDDEDLIKWKDGEDGEDSDDDLESMEDDEDAELSGSASDDDEDDEEDEEDEDDEEDDEEDDAQDEDNDMDGAEDDDDDMLDDKAALFGGEAGPSRRKNRHPTLDDDFFSIDEFNRLTEEAEAENVSGGRLGGDEEEDENDLGDAGAMMLQGAPDEDEDIMYNDFFAAPRTAKPDSKGKGKGKGKANGKPDKKGKGKAKGVQFDEEDEEMEFDEEEEDEEEGRDVMGRFKGDLFDSDDEEEAGEKILSTHEKQQLALAKQIAELESEAIGPKDWTLLGEATSKARPENSLLEEDLDFEQVGKVVPVITEERVQSLEDMIKKRIIDNNFDSTVRVRAYEATPYLPSRYLELQDTQSAKSLAQIYEEEYQTAAAGGQAKDPRDEKLRKEHEEIDKLWGDICYKLDALSSLNFVPKAPKAQITTVDNLPTATMESALPPTSAATTLLAPEEMFAPPSSSALISRSELTPEQAQSARGKRKREKKTERRKLGDMADLYGKKKGVKAEKERALQDLVKTGKGVTVVGKGEKERGKAVKRAAAEEAKNDGKRLKL